jgi:hypothetical protein
MEPLIVDHQELDAPARRGVPGVGAGEAYVGPGAAPNAPGASPHPPIEERTLIGSPATPAPVRPPAAVRSSRTMVIPAGYRMVETIWLCLGIVLALLTLDFIFRAAGAHSIGFATLVYRIGSALASPFTGIFSATVTGDGHVYQWGDLLAIAVYALAGVGTVAAVRILTSRRVTSIETTS